MKKGKDVGMSTFIMKHDQIKIPEELRDIVMFKILSNQEAMMKTHLYEMALAEQLDNRDGGAVVPDEMLGSLSERLGDQIEDYTGHIEATTSLIHQIISASLPPEQKKVFDRVKALADEIEAALDEDDASAKKKMN